MILDNILAVVAGLVSVTRLAFTIIKYYVSRLEKEPRIIVRISTGFLTLGDIVSEGMLFLEVANAGEKKVTIQGVKVVWGRRAAFFSEGIVGTRDW